MHLLVMLRVAAQIAIAGNIGYACYCDARVLLRVVRDTDDLIQVLRILLVARDNLPGERLEADLYRSLRVDNLFLTMTILCEDSTCHQD